MGRPTLLTEAVLNQVEHLHVQDQPTNKIARLLSISHKTAAKARKEVERRLWLRSFPLPENEDQRELLRECFRARNLTRIKELHPHTPKPVLKYWYALLFPNTKPTPVEQRREGAKALFMHGRTLEEIATTYTVTTQCVRNWLKDAGVVLPDRRNGRTPKRPRFRLMEEHYGSIRDYTNIYYNQGITKHSALARRVSDHFAFRVTASVINLILTQQRIEQGRLTRLYLPQAFDFADLSYVEGFSAREITYLRDTTEPAVYRRLQTHCAWVASYFNENPLMLWDRRRGKDSRIKQLHQQIPAETRPNSPTRGQKHTSNP